MKRFVGKRVAVNIHCDGITAKNELQRKKIGQINNSIKTTMINLMCK